MTHRAVRLIVLLTAIAAVAAGGYFFVGLEQRLADVRNGVARFDAGSRDARLLVEMLRTAQQSYVAQGQGPEFWMKKAADHTAALRRELGTLASTATGDGAREALATAQSALDTFEKTDRRARAYVESGQELTASDVIFADSLRATSTIATELDAARLDERSRAEAAAEEITERRTHVLAAAAAICLVAVILLLPRVPMPRPPDTREQLRALINDRTTPGSAAARPVLPVRAAAAAISPPATPRAEPAFDAAAPSIASETSFADLALTPAETPTAAPEPPPVPESIVPAPVAPPGVDLSTAAAICSDLARVLDPADLQLLLKRAAELLDAKGLVVWVADRAGAALFPTLTTGYSQAVVARMGTIAPNDENAAADAFRNGEVRLVEAEAAGPGALVVPITTAEGCVGVLAAEMHPGAALDGDTTAVARIIAAQLATFVTTVPAPAEQ
jgi:hypothetical protein